MTEIEYNNILSQIYENAKDMFFQTGIHLKQYQIEILMREKDVYDIYKARELKESRIKKINNLKNQNYDNQKRN